jgi:hypothetical protein
MSILKNLTQSRTARVGVALGVATATALSLTQSPASAATQALKLSSATGPELSTTKVLSVVGTGFKSATGTSLLTAVEFQSNATCNAASGGSNVTAVTVKNVVSATSMAITTPSLATAASSVPKTYQLCLYTAASTALLGSAAYTVYATPSVTSSTVASGPSSGGQAVTVGGTNFTAKSTVTVGGVAATGVKFTSATALSFVTPKTTAGSANIVVTTEGGKSSAYTYNSLNAVVVSPKTGVVDGGDVITVTGAGFDALDFSAGANNDAVMFVPGVYVKGVHGVGGSGAAKLCLNVQVISDTELVCTTPDFGTPDTSDASFIVTVVKDKASTGSPVASVVSSSAAFTAAAF